MYEFFYILAIQVWTMCRFNMVVVYMYIFQLLPFFFEDKEHLREYYFLKTSFTKWPKNATKKRVDARS